MRRLRCLPPRDTLPGSARSHTTVSPDHRASIRPPPRRCDRIRQPLVAPPPPAPRFSAAAAPYRLGRARLGAAGLFGPEASGVTRDKTIAVSFPTDDLLQPL